MRGVSRGPDGFEVLGPPKMARPCRDGRLAESPCPRAAAGGQGRHRVLPDRGEVLAHLVRPEVSPRLPERAELRRLLDGMWEPRKDADREALIPTSRTRPPKPPSRSWLGPCWKGSHQCECFLLGGVGCLPRRK